MLRPLVVSGPSGAGKSTLLKRLFKEFPDMFGFSVSHTTRKPRQGEVNGVDYWFVSEEDFQSMIQQGDFIEHAKFSNNFYGSSWKAVEDVLKSGKICILDIEIQGVMNVKKSDLNAAYCWVSTPSLEELEKRLTARGTETEQSLAERLNAARNDIMLLETKPDLFDQYIVNDELDRAYDEFKKFIFSVNSQTAVESARI